MEKEVHEGRLRVLKCELSQKDVSWRQEVECYLSRVETLEEKLMEAKASIQLSEDDAKEELDLLLRRFKAATTMLTYLKSKARIMAIQHLAHASCGIKHEEGVGYIDRHGIQLANWSKDVDLSLLTCLDEEKLADNDNNDIPLDANDGPYTNEIFGAVRTVTAVMDSLVKRVILAETETANEKEKANSGLEEIRRKTLQIERMSVKVEEMEKFALETNGVLDEMRQKVDYMVQETSRQRQRATENEQELFRVKQEFGALGSYVRSLISVRETLLSSEKQFQTLEKLLDWLITKTTHLENEKEKKEAEIQKLMAENIRLNALLDLKEAQFLAMNEQCKFMALSNRGSSI